ncbi:MAG: OmpH family outer membrane protein [Saprospiraceae bacterium]|jgi:outer membrane protein|nr:OmpH family outer membrane protein [Saprospiraceae bacterium]MBL0025767.1 OmpH family outer membrane protein [Saprospiraceae bacterium]
MKRSLFILFFSVTAIFCLSAQKFGYVNTQELLSGMSEMKLADNQVKALQNELLTKGEEMVIKFENDYKAYMKEANGGTLSKVLMQQKESVLVAKQEEIKKYEEEIQQKVAAKREELYKPIIEKVKAEITKLGKEGKYTIIFDSAPGMILHAADTENLMDILKTKLGIN